MRTRLNPWRKFPRSGARHWRGVEGLAATSPCLSACSDTMWQLGTNTATWLGKTVKYKSKRFVGPLPFPMGAADPEEIAPIGDEKLWFLLGVPKDTIIPWQ